MANTELTKDEKLDTFLEDFLAKHLKFPQSNIEIQILREAVQELVSNIVEKIDLSGVGWTMKQLLPVGSMAEGTRNSLPDEFDFMVVVGKFELDDTVKSVISTDKGTFLKLKYECKRDVECFRNMCNCNCASEENRCECDCFSYWESAKRSFVSGIERTLMQMKQSGMFCGLPSLPGKLRVDNCNVEEHGPATTLQLLLETDDTRMESTSMKISIDLVPAIEFKINSFCLQTLEIFHENFSRKLRDTNKIHIIPHKFKVDPQRKELVSLCKVSFASTEFVLMQEENEVHKKCHMLLKYMYPCDFGISFSSFIFKNLVLQHAVECGDPGLGKCLIKILLHLQHIEKSREEPFIPHIFNTKHNLLQYGSIGGEKRLSQVIEDLQQVRNGLPIFSSIKIWKRYQLQSSLGETHVVKF